LKVWKPLSKFRYSEERNEYKYHTDFALEEAEDIVIFINGKKLLREIVPKGKERKYHFEMAVESFEKTTD